MNLTGKRVVLAVSGGKDSAVNVVGIRSAESATRAGLPACVRDDDRYALAGRDGHLLGRMVGVGPEEASVILRDDYGHEWAPYYQDDLVTLYQGDVRVLAPLLPKPVGRTHVLTDAPYLRHTHEKSRAGARKTALASGDGKVRPASYHREVDFGFAPLSGSLRHTIAEQSRRLATHWILLFADAEGQGAWQAALEENRLEHVRAAFWDKDCGSPQFTGDRPGVPGEIIEVAHQTDEHTGKPVAKAWNGRGKRGIYRCATVIERGGSKDGEPKVYETQKPERLISELILDFTEEGDTVIDFCAGSCTTLICAARLKRRSIGVELRMKGCEVGATRRRADLANVSYYAAKENPNAHQHLLFTEVP